VAAGLLAGCGSATPTSSSVTLRPDQRPVRIGRGRAFRLPALSPAASRRAEIAGLRCTREHGGRYGIHLELYARRLVLPVPAGIGVAPPQRRRGAYVLGGPCSYPVRSFEPTGVIEVDRVPAGFSLGDLFAIWGQPLSNAGLAGFHGPVEAFVAGVSRPGDPRSIRLRAHAEIVLEVGGFVAPHPSYQFPPGL
jgi:hypothetical protein